MNTIELVCTYFISLGSFSLLYSNIGTIKGSVVIHTSYYKSHQRVEWLSTDKEAMAAARKDTAKVDTAVEVMLKIDVLLTNAMSRTLFWIV